ncbi:MAG: hypothetical protein ABH858_00865 [Candidatus Omnitrophota bacterium]
MEVKLDTLIDKIKQDGVVEAKKQSEAIIKQARDEAESLVKKAKEEAGKIRDNAGKEAERFQKNGEAALKQAGRDLILSLKDKVRVIFEVLLREKIGEQLDGQFLNEVILKIIDNWSPQSGISWEILINPRDEKNLRELISGGIAEKIAKGIEIKISPAVEKGLRLGVKDKNLYYEFSDESIAQSLAEFLSPRIGDLLKAGQ